MQTENTINGIRINTVQTQLNKNIPNVPINTTIQLNNITIPAQQIAAANPTPVTTVTKPPKISRDSLIHKNDVFQFDDVESVHTSDIYFKSTPMSSFESDDTYRSSSILGSSKNHKQLKDKKLKTSFITPIFRGVNTNGLPNTVKAKKDKNLRPKSISSASSNISSKLKKSNTNNAINAHDPSNNAYSNTNSTSVTSLDAKNSFSKHFNSLKRLINRTSSQSLFDKNNTLNVNSPIVLNSSNKQLTIPYSNNTSPSETVKEESFLSNNSSNNNNNDNQYLSIPAMSNSTASFTISNKLDDSKITISDNNKSERKSKSFFKFKINKSKSPKKQ